MTIRFRHLAFLLVVASAAACQKDADQDGDLPPDPCRGHGDGRAFAVGQNTCLSITRVRARTNGSWRDLDPSSVDVVVGTTPASDVLRVSADGPVEAFSMRIEGVRASAMLQEGYQSWSFSGAVKIPATVAMDPDGEVATPAPLAGNPLDEAPGVSYGATILGDPGNGPAITLAGLSASVATTAFAATKDAAGDVALTIVYGAAREPLPMANGRTTSERILVAARPHATDALDAVTLLALPGDRATRAANVPPTGWFTWNELFSKATEADVLANADVVQAKLLPLGMTLVEIDDGWEVAWGDWRANAKFPSGMNGIAQQILSRGLVPGVWLAPFLVDTHADVAKTLSPDLFVKDATGAPLVHTTAGTTNTYWVLDGTNPDAMAVAAQPIADLRAAGFRFFKLDFLYAGAIPGARKDPTATGNQALLAGLATLRTAMGEDAVFNACGAPIFPLVGVADSLRIGTDTAYEAYPLKWANVVFAARSFAARRFLFPAIFLDADQTQVRAPYSPDEARASAFVAALGNGTYSLGDDLTKLGEDRFAIALDPTVLDVAAAANPATATDPLESPADDIVRAPVLDSIASPNSTGAPPPTTFTVTGKSGTKRTLAFAWTDTHAVTVSN